MKVRDLNLPQHSYNQGHYGELPMSALPSGSMDATINVVIDGGGTGITAGIKGDVVVDFDCSITSATLLADASGSIVIDIWRDSYAAYPPVNGDSITSATPPTLASAIKSQDITLTNWDTFIAAGSILRINVDSASVVQRVTLALGVHRV